MNLNPIKICKKEGNEQFFNSGGEFPFSVINFWQWSASDLLSNATRGKLAEFLVATAIGTNIEVRNEWDAYDLLTTEGIKLEVKTSAYLQSWFQRKLSKISFDVKPTREWNYKTNSFLSQKKRQSDFYIFCLLQHIEKLTVNPLNTDQWKFYLLPARTLNEQLGDQSTLSLNRLLSLKPVECKFESLKEEFHNMISLSNKK